MVYHLNGLPSLNPLKSLYSEDDEVDFFNNIVHLQVTFLMLDCVSDILSGFDLHAVFCCRYIEEKGRYYVLEIYWVQGT